jgi:hypothetical protein
MIAAMEQVAKPRIRWQTISLRGVLLLVIAIAVWLGWISNRAREQRETVKALQKFGGFVHYDWEFVNGPVKVPRGNLLWKPSWGKFTPTNQPWAPNWLRRPLGDEYFQSIAHVSLYVDIKKGFADATWVNLGPADEALRKLATQTSVRTLQLGGNQVTDENLACVGKMTGLEELSIGWGFHLTDKAFLPLAGLKRLRIFEVDHSKMTDASLAAIGKMTNLEELRIAGAGFSDRGLGHLKNLKRLTYLSLGEGNHTITDAGLATVSDMKALEYLDVQGWHITDGGLAKLRGMKSLKTVYAALGQDQKRRRGQLQRLLPGVKID